MAIKQAMDSPVSAPLPGGSFRTQLDAAAYLRAAGYRVSKSLFNAHFKKGLIPRNAAGLFEASALLRYAAVPGGRPLGDVTDQELKALVSAAKGFALSVRGTEGFESAQVTAGGIRTDEFDPATMGSLLVPGLYACGEVLDIDGDCGGYNLQWAWSSGRLAGQSAGRNDT